MNKVTGAQCVPSKRLAAMPGTYYHCSTHHGRPRTAGSDAAGQQVLFRRLPPSTRNALVGPSCSSDILETLQVPRSSQPRLTSASPINLRLTTLDVSLALLRLPHPAVILSWAGQRLLRCKAVGFLIACAKSNFRISASNARLCKGHGTWGFALQQPGLLCPRTA